MGMLGVFMVFLHFVARIVDFLTQIVSAGIGNFLTGLFDGITHFIRDAFFFVLHVSPPKG
jgi:hypothetical protein